MFEVKCLDCEQVQRVEYHTVNVSGEIPRFCAYCGSQRVMRSRIDTYWYDLAQSLGFGRSEKSAELVQGLYRLWEPSEFSLFREFIDSCKRDGLIDTAVIAD